MEQLTVGQAIERIIESFGTGRLEDTVDTVKTGDAEQPLRGVVTTFLANTLVLQQAAQSGANLVITHEPTFYNHRDETHWLASDPIYTGKRDLIDRHEIVIWRCHDYIHARRPDGIIAGVLQDLGWEQYAHPERSYRCAIPPMTLGTLVLHLKQRLGITNARVIGDDEQICQNVGLLVGATGGKWHIRAFHDENLDTLIVGEINEWETSEYVRDARAQGHAKALIVVGHAASEEAGMRFLADLVRELFPQTTVSHVPAGDALRAV